MEGHKKSDETKKKKKREKKLRGGLRGRTSGRQSRGRYAMKERILDLQQRVSLVCRPS